MSGRRSRAERQRLGERPERIKNAERIQEMSQRMLALDLGHVPLARTTQFIVGWLRASFGQALAISSLTSSGRGDFAGPNRRSFAEIVVRLLWLSGVPSEERAGVLDSIIEDEKELTRRFFEKNLKELGYESDADLSAIDELVTQVTKHAALKDQAKRFYSAAKATDGKAAGLYYMWREETQYTHATGVLAATYAPEVDSRLGNGRPNIVDPDLHATYLCTVLAVAVSYRLLVEAGVEETSAGSLLDALFG